jgi:hypothetical protein
VHDSVSCANGNAEKCRTIPHTRMITQLVPATRCTCRGDGAIRGYLLAPTAPLLAVLFATSECTAHELFAAVCCIARTATTTSTAPLPLLRHRWSKKKKNGPQESASIRANILE